MSLQCINLDQLSFWSFSESVNEYQPRTTEVFSICKNTREVTSCDPWQRTIFDGFQWDDVRCYDVRCVAHLSLHLYKLNKWMYLLTDCLHLQFSVLFCRFCGWHSKNCNNCSRVPARDHCWIDVRSRCTDYACRFHRVYKKRLAALCDFMFKNTIVWT